VERKREGPARENKFRREFDGLSVEQIASASRLQLFFLSFSARFGAGADAPSIDAAAAAAAAAPPSTPIMMHGSCVLRPAMNYWK
jgi:hypothetical protein